MDPKKIILYNAFKTYVLIVIYFFAMKIFGLDEIVELRSLNFLFVIWGVNASIKKIILNNKNSDYLSNFGQGIATSLIAVGMTVISLIVYIGFVDSKLLQLMENSLVWGNQLSLAEVIFAIAVEGAASSVICSLIVMQYWKNYKERI
tara:strand:- start:7749 stop:8189 length:441 start_codon:yes stop_codon:yes gene_type:complete